MKHVFLYSFLLLLCLGCTDDRETIEHTPFVYFMLDNGSSQTIVTEEVNAINTYYVFLSSRTPDKSVLVEYAIEAGDGLTEGIDYQILTQGNQLEFLPGVFDMPIRIQWLPNRVDPNKDNTLTIRLTGTNAHYTLGMPGPDQKNRELIITKQ